MKNTIIITLAAVLLAACSGTGNTGTGALPSEVTISKEVLKDKILGAWAGQIIGCSYGGPTEFRYATIIDKNVDIPWGEHYVKSWYDNSPGLYDDVYMDLTFVDVFEKEGLDAPVESFAKAFAYAPYPLWHANAQARYNIMQGIMPPASGHWTNNPHSEDIDFQIEADYAGIMSPGMPNSSSHYCDAIGHMMNYGDGWYGGVYVAAMYALAFVSDDLDFITSEALKVIPAESKYHQAMADVLRWHREYPDSWEETWLRFNLKYGFDVGCPEGVYTAYNIDAVLNSAYILTGLLYGDKNFYRTIDISTRCGADSDCNPASAGGILGTILGWNAIPEYWRKPVEEVADRNLVYTEISLNKAAEMSFNQALKVIGLGGGSVSDSTVTIRTQIPEAVPLEVGFENHWPVGVQFLRRSISQVDTVRFDGNGIVIRYEFIKDASYKPHDYTAQVEVYLDGELSRTCALPAFGRGQATEFYYQYELPVGPHKLTFRWLNPESGIDIRLSRAIVYSDKPSMTVHCDE